MRIAVFGGSGKVGRALIPTLQEQGHRIRALQHRTALATDGAETICGSITDPAAVARTVEGADVVLQMTMLGNDIRQPVELSAHGTITVLDALRGSKSLKQYILTSSDAATGIWTHPQSEPISHTTPPTSYPGYYSLGKVLEEVIVREYHRNYGIPYTIARLSWVQQEDSILNLFLAGCNPDKPLGGPFDAAYSPAQKQRLQDGQPFVVLPCDQQGQPLQRTVVQRQDVIAAMAAMVGNVNALHETFHISGRAFAYDKPCRYLADKLGLPIEQVRLDAHSFAIDCSHTTEKLGWTAQYDVIAMIDAALTWRQNRDSGRR